MFCLLNCQGKDEVKAKAFYCILQEGSFDRLLEISAKDKDFDPAFLKLCTFATKATFQLAALLGKQTEIYTEEENNTMLNDESMEILREDHFLEAVYGATSRLHRDAWVEKV